MEESETPSVIPSSSFVENEYKHLNFGDQLTLKMLKELSGNDINTNISEKGISFGTSNSTFYPINARTPAMDRFQLLVDRDLRNLHDAIKTQQWKFNLSISENKALRDLQSMKN